MCVCDSERMSDELMSELADKSWKVRKEALDKLVALVNEVKFITSNIGPLPEALKPRLTDSNKILVRNMQIFGNVYVLISISVISHFFYKSSIPWLTSGLGNVEKLGNCKEED